MGQVAASLPILFLSLFCVQDYLQLDDDFDLEFTRLAEARSNPRLAIGEHIHPARVGEDVARFLQGETSSKDVMQTRSIDDLLDL